MHGGAVSTGVTDADSLGSSCECPRIRSVSSCSTSWHLPRQVLPDPLFMTFNKDFLDSMVLSRNSASLALAFFCIVLTTVAPGLIVECISQPSPGSNRIAHPTPENVPDPDTLAHFIAEGDTFSTDLEMQRLARWLHSATPVDTIGMSEGPRHYMFGEIVDAKVNSAGEIFVLDGEHRELFVYSETGEYQLTLGGPGEGPNEFAYPQGLYIDARDQIYVADRKPKVSVFARDNDSYSLASTIPLEFSPESVCVSNSILFVAGPWPTEDSNPIHTFSTTSGDYTGSIGQSYRSADPAVRLQLSDGIVSCVPDGNNLLYMYHDFPIILGYQVNGSYSWASSIEDYYGFEIIEIPSETTPWISSRPRGDTFDMVENIVPVQGSAMIVQVLRTIIDRPSETRKRQIRTYLMDSASGKGIDLGWSLPKIHALAPDFLIASTLDGFPRVVKYSLAPLSP